MHSFHHRRTRHAFASREFGRHAHGFGRWRGRRAERVFDQGDLRLVVLKLLAEAPSHGYEIIKAVEEKVGGAYSPSPGVIYPTLTLLEDLGFVTVESVEGGRKLYRVTPTGEAELKDKADAVEAIFGRMSDIHDRFEGPSPRIGRALQNLGGAIGLRVRAGRLAAEQLDALVEAIDEAARKIERI
jgi:DNA-binding PadR family transcriptional regulator